MDPSLQWMKFMFFSVVYHRLIVWGITTGIVSSNWGKTLLCCLGVPGLYNIHLLKYASCEQNILTYIFIYRTELIKL